MDRETMERIVVRLLALVRCCDNLSIRADLMLIARDLSDAIENDESDQSEKIQELDRH
jgi:hypothetical protein